MPISQERRLIQVSASFVPSDVLATDIQVNERFSAPFEIQLGLLSANAGLDSSSVIGQKVSIAIQYRGVDKPRYFHGRVNRLLRGDMEGEMRRYRLSIVPGMWFMTQSSHNRIYENRTALDIVNEVLKSYGDFCTVTPKTKGSYLTREYCVQYGESDFAFVSRLLAEEGITYYFTFSKTDHTLILCDDVSGYMSCEESKVPYDLGSPEQSGVQTWQREMQFHSNAYEMSDYNHDTPKNNYLQSVTTRNKFAQKPGSEPLREFSAYNFKVTSAPIHDFDATNNKQMTQRRLEGLECGHDIANGSSDCVTFQAGGRFTLEHAVKSENGNYVITSIQHMAVDGNDQDAQYRNRFSCIPAAVPYRPMQEHFKKQMRGPLTAVVTSLNASESKADADPHRMVKVKFPWESQKTSCWVRVAQLYAGSNWGASFVPRLNQEVLVEFLNGDPDRPVIVGALYNKDNQGPQYTSTQSGIKTASAKFNEWRFDDKKDNEEIYVEAGKNYNFIIHNDETGNIEHDQKLTVKNDRTLEVSEGNEVKKIVKGTQTLEVGGDQKNTLKANQTNDITGNQKTEIKGSQTTKVTGAIKEESTQSITLTANMSIELKVGGNSIKIDPSGVTITGTMVKINGNAMTEVKGGGMLKMQGGLVMIN
ncbi:MAG TPA: type VI secretion system tip protein TssI/VgrG [Dongiaceae bacterium]|nr:type VI secretion system tip protein TssI/VgrG [Dongiaceae bacterium]